MALTPHSEAPLSHEKPLSEATAVERRGVDATQLSREPRDCDRRTHDPLARAVHRVRMGTSRNPRSGQFCSKFAANRQEDHVWL
jgi:hypothetical protein